MLLCIVNKGVDNLLHSILFASCILGDETYESFRWAFEQFCKAVEDTRPITIFTDEDEAMAQAIADVFGANVLHRLCIWHLSKNFRKNLASIMGNVYNDLCIEFAYKENLSEDEWLLVNSDIEVLLKDLLKSE